jgi:hypothetical protein
MTRHHLFNVFLTIASVMLVVGCSKKESIVSLDDTQLSPVAGIGDLQVQDVATAGTNILWGLSLDPVSGATANSYIYKYNFSTSSWVSTGHWGTDIATTSQGICYHANSNVQVWWADGNGNYGQISIAGTDLTSISDIGAAYFNSYDWVWITGQNSQNEKKVWRTNISISGNSRTPVYWQNATSPYFTPTGIACDPYNGYKAIAVDYSNGYIWYTSDSGVSWTLQNGAPSYPIKAAICDNKVVVSAGASTMIYAGSVNQNYSYTGISGAYGPVAAGNSTYFYYITWNALQSAIGSF